MGEELKRWSERFWCVAYGAGLVALTNHLLGADPAYGIPTTIWFSGMAAGAWLWSMRRIGA